MAPPPKTEFFWTYVLDDLENEESSAHHKDRALEALFSLFEFYRKNDHVDDLYADTEFLARIMKVCLSEISRRAKENENSRVANERIVKLMTEMVIGDASLIDEVVECDEAFRWILDGICKEDVDDHKTTLLCTFGTHARREARVTVLIRHFHALREAISCIIQRNVVDISDIHDLVYYYDGENLLAGLLALNPNLLCYWAEKTAKKDKNRVCNILMYVLEISIESPSTLMNLLGCDLLSISKHISLLPAPYYHVHEHAAIFRRILEKIPQFGQKYREWTKGGVVGNAVADLGRSIPPKDASRSAEYTFYDEDWMV